MTTLTDFLLARIAEDEAATWRLLDWETPADWPQGYVGRECLICHDASFGGTPAAMTETAQEHDEAIHRRSRVLAECEAKRRIVNLAHAISRDDARSGALLIEALAEPYADHSDYREEWKP